MLRCPPPGHERAAAAVPDGRPYIYHGGWVFHFIGLHFIGWEKLWSCKLRTHSDSLDFEIRISGGGWMLLFYTVEVSEMEMPNQESLIIHPVFHWAMWLGERRGGSGWAGTLKKRFLYYSFCFFGWAGTHARWRVGFIFWEIFWKFFSHLRDSIRFHREDFNEILWRKTIPLRSDLEKKITWFCSIRP